MTDYSPVMAWMPPVPEFPEDWQNTLEMPADVDYEYHAPQSQIAAADAFIAGTKFDRSFIKNGEIIRTAKYPDPIWILPGFIPIGLTILAGRPKVGKSWLILQIAQAVQAGGRIFGVSIPQGRVLYLALEDNERRLKERMNKQGWVIAASVDFITMPAFRAKVGALHKGGWARLVDIVKDGDYRLVVIDTLSRAFFGLKDINDNSEVLNALSPLQETAITAGFALVVIDHHKKPNGDNGDPIDDVMGATSKAGVLDTVIGIYKDREKKTMRMKATGRDIETADITISFDPVTGCWQSEGNTAEYVKEQSKREILSALRTHSILNLKQLSEHTGQAKPHLSQRLAELVNQGLVTRMEITSQNIVWQAKTP
jgi:DNA-binding transcriptional ArsR family regulator